MSQIQIGQSVPDFTLRAAAGGEITLSEYRGRKVLLYFYPKSMTPACTQEACEFRDAHDTIAAKDAVVFGISPDSPELQVKFAAKHSLPFPLLSDENHTVSELFGVWQLKKLYGREFMGIVRSTFLIDEEGKLAAAWRKIRVKGHVDAVLGEIVK
ncbi:thioredoxin-dependent thiol peroxidase [Paenibacillus tepidiphilus]|uniref:thioredoxin-dependent thiol peroxidase n=1 Tax=Paenibacillus tepidiphilus TaxID=2608683 RepID=UPI001239E272|nr:thioredoxin-dependent thiol peroxidase [Paenibacillus tepidiphilus]